MQGTGARHAREQNVWIGPCVKVIGSFYLCHPYLIPHIARYPKKWIERIWTAYAMISCPPPGVRTKLISICCNFTLPMVTCWQASFHHSPTIEMMSMGETLSIV